MISDRLWQTRFRRAPDAVGQRIVLERVPFTIIGVAPPGFFGLNVGSSFDVILPVETEPLIGRIPARLESPYWQWLQVMSRLPAGQTTSAVTDALRSAQPSIREATMPPYARDEDRKRYMNSVWVAEAAPAPTRAAGPSLRAAKRRA